MRGVVRRTDGSSTEGIREAEGTIRWSRSSKNERYVRRISSTFTRRSLGTASQPDRGGCDRPAQRNGGFRRRSQMLRSVPPLRADRRGDGGRPGQLLGLDLEPDAALVDVREVDDRVAGAARLLGLDVPAAV